MSEIERRWGAPITFERKRKVLTTAQKEKLVKRVEAEIEALKKEQQFYFKEEGGESEIYFSLEDYITLLKDYLKRVKRRRTA